MKTIVRLLTVFVLFGEVCYSGVFQDRELIISKHNPSAIVERKLAASFKPLEYVIEATTSYSVFYYFMEEDKCQAVYAITTNDQGLGISRALAGDLGGSYFWTHSNPGKVHLLDRADKKCYALFAQWEVSTSSLICVISRDFVDNVEDIMNDKLGLKKNVKIWYDAKQSKADPAQKNQDPGGP
jgi:hypothetical protein